MEKEYTCIYCGKQLNKNEVSMVLKKRNQLYACLEGDCVRRSQLFLEHDRKFRKIMYIAVGLLVIPLTIMYALGDTASKISYAMLSAACIFIFIFPFPFTDYKSYRSYGIKKTVLWLRIIVCVTAVVGVLNIVVY